MIERCNGPGQRIIFDTRDKALAALRRRGKGKRANVHQGKVYSCPWGGDHWHYSSKRNPGRK